jgi:DnaJ domain
VAEDPYAVLGVEPGATADELRAARRRLAMELHPDRAGGSVAATEAMQRLNLAYDAAVARLGEPAAAAPASAAAPPPAPPDVRGPVPRPGGRLAYDVASFTIEALPAEAFEALYVVAGWLGEVIDDEPPYRLDVWLGEPFDCWCRLDLVPDAGASTVALTLGSIDARPVPDLDAVRDTWVAELNTLGRVD